MCCKRCALLPSPHLVPNLVLMFPGSQRITSRVQIQTLYSGINCFFLICGDPFPRLAQGTLQLAAAPLAITLHFWKLNLCGNPALAAVVCRSLPRITCALVLSLERSPRAGAAGCKSRARTKSFPPADAEPLRKCDKRLNAPGSAISAESHTVLSRWRESWIWTWRGWLAYGHSCPRAARWIRAPCAAGGESA